MPRGRKAITNGPTVQWHFVLPEDLTTKVDLLLTDPLTGKVKYGARTQLIERLLRRWLREQIEAGPEKGGFEPDTGRYAGNRDPETEDE